MQDGGAVLLLIKETWLRRVRASWSDSVQMGKEPCVAEMKTKPNSHSWKSKIGCLWESNRMWFLISFSFL